METAYKRAGVGVGRWSTGKLFLKTHSFTQPFIHGFFFFLFEKGTHYDCVVLASLELAFLF